MKLIAMDLFLEKDKYLNLFLSVNLLIKINKKN